MTAHGALPDRLVDDAVRGYASSQPDALAVVAPSGSVTYGQLDAAADRFAGSLASAGVGAGARIGWLGSNDPTYLIAVLGTWRRRASLVGLNHRLPPDDIVAAAESVGLDHLVVGPGFEQVSDGLAARGVGVSHVVGSPAAWPDHTPVEPLQPVEDDEAIVFFTSGSTGRPKAVPLTRGAYERTVAAPNVHRFTSKSRLLIVPPAFHLAGAMWAQYGLLAGATQYYMDDPSPPSLVAMIREHGITHAVFVPTLIRAVVDEVRRDPRPLPSLQHVAYGASPISRTLLQAAVEALQCEFCQVYGLTEAGGVVTFLPPEEHHLQGEHTHRLASAGRPAAGVELRVRELVSREDLPVGESGELWFRTPFMTEGYIGRDDATKGLLVDGWLRTQDVGYVDEDGFVYVQGRSDNMIVTGGENVHPEHIEDVLDRHPRIAEAAVFGLPDPKWGQRVCAAVVAADEGALTVDDILTHCRQHLANYEVPKDIELVSALPRTATGKIVRAELQRRAAPEGTDG